VLVNLRVCCSLCRSRLATYCVVLIRSELRFCMLDKVCLVCLSGIHHSCYGRLFCRQIRTSVKRGMTEVRFGDFVLGIVSRMLLRHEFLTQNYSGGTSIIIGENIQCNSDRPWKAVNRNSPLQLPATEGGGGATLFCRTSISALEPTLLPILCVPVFFPGGKAGQGVMLPLTPGLSMSGAIPLLLS